MLVIPIPVRQPHGHISPLISPKCTPIPDNPMLWEQQLRIEATRKRIFLLGPSHHVFLTGCALSKCERYETPLGDLVLDKETISELEKTSKFEKMSQSTDEAEHSLEMHLPYIYKVLSK